MLDANQGSWQIRLIEGVEGVVNINTVEEHDQRLIQLLKKSHNQNEGNQRLQRFLWMVHYLAKFVPNLSDISAPLRKLLEKDTAWHW